VRVIPINELSIGNDWSIDIFDPLTNGIQSFSLITGFTKQQDTTTVTSNALDGIVRRAHLPNGWTGTITFDRSTPAIDNYFSAREDAYYAGRVQPPCTLTETIKEVDGSITQFRYEGVSFALNQGGNAQGKDRVEMSIEFTASRRRKVI
jgi:hypothetical protein